MRRLIHLAVGLLLLCAPAMAVEEYDEVDVKVEINATDGDAGFHVLHDADGWHRTVIKDPEGDIIFNERAFNALREQGMTENFFESSEPVCRSDDEEEDFVPLRTFLDRFAMGDYKFRGWTLDGDRLVADAELTYDLPAAPKVIVRRSGGSVFIRWRPGTDLGNCDDPSLVADGTIPDPADVDVLRWEVAIEPNEDALPGEELPEGVPFMTMMVHLPGDARRFRVPPEYLAAYAAAGVRAFKVEVGAMEESGNQTFTERLFGI